MGITPFRAIPPLSDRDRQRFESKVERSDSCWLWKGWTRDGIGYGLFNISFQTEYGSATGQFAAHRIAYVLTNGAIPPGYDVLHSCDVRACVNPAHLRIGTDQDNALDKTLRGRHPRGGRIPGIALVRRVLPPRFGERRLFTKWNDEQIREMRQRYAREDTATAAGLGREYGMGKNGAALILTGQSRREAGGPIASALRPIVGRRVPGSKLTDAVIAQIREAYGAGQGTLDDLAAQFQIVPQTVSKIVQGKAWKHVPGVGPPPIRVPQPNLEPPSVNRALGEHHHAAKLTDRAVVEIRTRYAETPDLTATDLAREYRVSKTQVCFILKGKSRVRAGGPLAPIRVLRGQRARGAAKPKLDAARVTDIRQRYAEGGETIYTLAKRFGVSAGLVSDLIRGKAWKHLPLPPGLHVRPRHRKLTAAEVDAIRCAGTDRNVTHDWLARRFGISRSAVSFILEGKAHGPNPYGYVARRKPRVHGASP